MSDLTARLRLFALRCLKVADALPRKPSSKAIANQLARSATGAAANYRASQKARSKAEFRAKLQIALEEADETQFWLDLVLESKYLPVHRLQGLVKESQELTAILVASLKTARRSN